MRRFVFLTALVICGSIALLACKANDEARDSTRPASATEPLSATTPATRATPDDGVRRMTIVELRDAMEKGEAIIVDVRSETEYKRGHIKGARSLPRGEIAKRADELPKDKLIVSYCA